MRNQDFTSQLILGLADSDIQEFLIGVNDQRKQNEIFKRNIINTLTQGFAQNTRKDIICNADIKISDTKTATYLNLLTSEEKNKLLFLKEGAPYNVKDAWFVVKNFTPEYGGNSEISYIAESEKYKVTAQASNLILLIHEITKGIFEILALHGQTNAEKEDLEFAYKVTDTFSEETFGLVYGEFFSEQLENVFNKTEQNLIDRKIIRNKILHAFPFILAEYYSLSAEKFLKISNRVFQTDDNQLPVNEFEDFYLNFLYTNKLINNDVYKTNRMNVDKILERISHYGMDFLTSDEKQFLENH
jgi:hypothetical protein